MEVSQELKIELPYNPAIPLLGIYPKKMKPLSRRDICTPTSTAALFTRAKTWKQPKCPSRDEWIKNMFYIYMCVCVCIYIYISQYTCGILFSHEKGNPFVTTWMDLEGIMLSEIS